MIKKIIFFTYGDSRLASTWSNVPFLFSNTLEDKGIEVVRINIGEIRWLRNLWNYTIAKVLNLFFYDQQYYYNRSFLNYFFVERTIQKAVKENKDADYCFFMCFDFYNRYSTVPSLLFGDWTFEMYIKNRMNRKPYFFENWVLKKNRIAIKNSEILVSLFPDCKDQMEKLYKREVKHLEVNVVNDLNNNKKTQKEILEQKRKSNHFVFIGRDTYLSGLKKLISAFDELKVENSELRLDVIGMTEEQFGTPVEGVAFHGFLHKDNKADNLKYYDILNRAKFLINPSDEWAGYSSSIEAMYYFTPLIIPKYKDFVSEFGSNMDFGYYLEDTSTDTIKNSIKRFFLDDNYPQYCTNAHLSVKDYTWDNYVSKLLESLEK